jgi:hypothetical protein
MFEVVQSPWQAKIADQITGDEEHELAPQARIRYSWPGMSRNAVSDAVDNALRLAVPVTSHPAKVVPPLNRVLVGARGGIPGDVRHVGTWVCLDLRD